MRSEELSQATDRRGLCVMPRLLLVRPDVIDNPEEYLSSAEKEYIQNLHNAQVRQNWMVSRVLIKRLTEIVLAQSQSGEFVYSDYTVSSKNKNGKGCQPFVTDKNGVRLPFRYALSHLIGCVAAGIDSRAPLGVDLCKIGSVPGIVERRLYTEREKNALANAAPEFHPVLSSMIWATKEAAYKLLSIQTHEPFVPARYELNSSISALQPAQTTPFTPYGSLIDFSDPIFSLEKAVYTGKEKTLQAVVQFCQFDNVVIALAKEE